MSAPVYTPPTPPTAPYSVPMVYSETPIAPPATDYYASPTSTLIKTEARKVIITQLPQSTSTADLHDLLFSTIAQMSKSYSYEAVEDVEIATHADGTPRGHGFAVLESYSLAKSVVKSLDGFKFQGRTLQARFAKEGVEPTTRQYLAQEELHPTMPSTGESQASVHGVAGSPHKRTSKSSRGKEHTSEHAYSSKPRHGSKSSERKSIKGSSSDRKEKHKSKSTASESTKKLSTVDQPLIVDGSSSRRHHK